jgi:hypothetical protein
MTEAEKLADKFRAGRAHHEYQRAMATEPVTWLTTAIIIALVMGLSIALTMAWYPWDDLDKMPPAIKGMMMFSWIPTIGAAVASAWLLFDAAGLAMLPGRHELTVIGHRVDTPAPYHIKLISEDGTEREYRARRRAASVVKLRLLTPGEIGVAVFKGDICVEWIALPLNPERIYDLR